LLCGALRASVENGWRTEGFADEPPFFIGQAMLARRAALFIFHFPLVIYHLSLGRSRSLLPQ
jgi:hypothetical protein